MEEINRKEEEMWEGGGSLAPVGGFSYQEKIWGGGHRAGRTLLEGSDLVAFQDSCFFRGVGGRRQGKG